MDPRSADPTRALARGTVLRSYEVGGILGRGGFGVVYKARHVELQTEVAIKEFFPSELAMRLNHDIRPSRSEHESPFEDGLRRFVEEAKRLESLRDCPTIVTCRDLFRANGTAYMVMDYVDGLSLSALLQSRESSGEPFNEQDLLDVVEPLVAGLQEVHDSGVYHRDIKPSNILIRRANNQPVLIDFGAAKQETAGLTKSMAPYTDGYAAMEQIGEGDIGPWTDVYGVGAVMWRMVAGGAPPFDPPNPTPVQRRIYEVMQGGRDPMPSAAELGNGRFVQNLLETIDSCIQIQPTKRLQTCQDVLHRITKSKASSITTKTPSVHEDVSEEYILPTARLKSSVRWWGTVGWLSISTSVLIIACFLAYARGYETESFLGIIPYTTTVRALIAIFFLVAFFMGILSVLFWWIFSNRLEKLKYACEAFKNGLKYTNGEGIPRDDKVAFKWFLLAAENGHAEAQFILGSMYEQGIGVKQDSVQAQMWYEEFSVNKYR